MIPIIDIQYSDYLDQIYKAWIWNDPRYKKWVCPSLEYVNSKASLFSHLWNRVGHDILNGICKNTGLSFKRNYFSVYVVSGNSRSFSNPIVVKSRYSPTEFVDVVTHELIHCLFVDNTDSAFVRSIDDFDDHVVLYAVMESVLPGTVHKQLDAKNFPANETYLKAMLYVKENGYKGILSKCRSITS